jgi:hypothetical protein
MGLHHVAKRRLLKLADKLDEVAEDNKLRRQFDLDSWKSDTYKRGTCNSTACACGFAASIPSFKKQGLRVVEDGDYYDNDTNKEVIQYELKYAGYESLEAAEKFFYLEDWEDADYLFFPGCYPENKRKSAKYVANRIRSYVNSGGKKLQKHDSFDY